MLKKNLTQKNNTRIKNYLLAHNRIIIVNLIYIVLMVFFLINVITSSDILERQVSLYGILATAALIAQSIIFKNETVSSIIHITIFPLMFMGFMIFNVFSAWVLLFTLMMPVVTFTLFDRKAASWILLSMSIIWLSFGILIMNNILITGLDMRSFWTHHFLFLIISVFSGFLTWLWDYQIRIALKNLYFDKLTDLPNRHKYMDEISSIPDPFVMLVDIDSFIEINDGFGASVGNQIIREIVPEIRDALFNLEYRLYRLHSDDFLVVFPHQGANSNFSYEQIAKELIKNVAERRFEGNVDGFKYDVHITVSIGMCRAPQFEKSELLAKADTALKNARADIKSFEIFSSDQDKEHQFKDNMRWLNILTEALLDKRVVPYFQPIFDNVSGKVSKHEALVRLISDKGEIISPFFFLEIAQKSRLYPRITQTMFNAVVQLITNSGTDISINLSIRDIFNPETTMVIENTLNRHPFVARHLIFELLETYQLEHSPQLASFIHNMKIKGVRFAIDDFGSGYSNYEYILRLNLDYLKIAGELVKDIHQIAESRILVENISSFAKKLGIKTIAEYVHNEEVQNIIKDIGVDYSQGFFLGKPEEHIITTD